MRSLLGQGRCTEAWALHFALHYTLGNAQLSMEVPKLETSFYHSGLHMVRAPIYTPDFEPSF